MTATERTTAIAEQIAAHLSYRLGRSFRVEIKTIRCDGGADVASASVVVSRPNAWPLVVAAFVDGVRSFQLEDASIEAAVAS